MYAAMRFTLEKGRSIPAPQFMTRGGFRRFRLRAAGFVAGPPMPPTGVYGTTGVGPDLYTAAQDATRAMIDHLAGTYDLSREDAYVLSSLCVDLRISEIVDAGQYVVSALLPLGIFLDHR